MSNRRLGAMKKSEIVIFPVARRTGDIERCAAELDRLNGEAAVTYWKTECRRLAAELSERGMPEEAVRQEVLDFQASVQVELLRRHQSRAIAESREKRKDHQRPH
ncbi:DUF6074 family protein [Oryzifoliimicrobium ureilyticus]|uniref:DUF6074 family protein n=1 Tax=Oryzifoliimicrobium ureilyticus TaxID=3113724 RepID=UPI003075F3BC